MAVLIEDGRRKLEVLERISPSEVSMLVVVGGQPQQTVHLQPKLLKRRGRDAVLI